MMLYSESCQHDCAELTTLNIEWTFLHFFCNSLKKINYTGGNTMMKKSLLVIMSCLIVLAAILWFKNADAQYKSTAATKTTEKAANVDTCYGCHDPIKQ